MIVPLLIKDILRFFVLALVQLFVLNDIHLGGLYNPYIYILFILLLPFETPGWLLLVLSFLSGLCIDYFSHQHGLHTAASVFLGFMRPFILRWIAPREGYENVVRPGIQDFGLPWFLRYALFCTLLHHAFLFYMEIFRLSDFFYTLARIIISTIFTVVLILLIEYMFYKKA